MIRQEFTNLVLDRKDLLSLYDGGFNLLPSGQNKILSLITTEIEKAENPYMLPLGSTYYQATEEMRRTILNLTNEQKMGFEECRQSILNLLKEQI